MLAGEIRYHEYSSYQIVHALNIPAVKRISELYLTLLMCFLQFSGFLGYLYTLFSVIDENIQGNGCVLCTEHCMILSNIVPKVPTTVECSRTRLR